MYFSGQFAIDPADMTEIVAKAPTKVFSRMARAIPHRVGDVTSERETFAAAAILQRLNMTMRAVGVDNIIHLSCDDQVVYDDTEGIADDFRTALIAFARSRRPDEGGRFEVLTLALEHSSELLQYLLEIEVLRTHQTGAPPIEIRVNAVFGELASTGGTISDASRRKLDELTGDQQWYDSAQQQAAAEFGLFMDSLEEACRTHLRVDRLSRSENIKVIKRSTTRRGSASHAECHDPIFYEGYHYEDRSAYLWHWSDYCFRNQCVARDCQLVDESGQMISVLDDEGLVVETEPDGEDPAAEADTSAPAETGAECEDAQAECGDAQAESIPAEQSEPHDIDSAPDEAFAASDDSRSTSSQGGWLSSLFGGSDSGGWFGSESDGGGDSDGGGCGGCGGCGE